MENITNNNEIYKALIAVQSELSNPERNVEGYGYKYTDLATLLTQVKPVLKAHGLGLVQQTISTTAGGIGFFAGVKTILIHESGQSIESEYYLPMPDMKSQTQAAGAAITYARRYAVSALLNIASEEDTDGASTLNKVTIPGARSEKPTNSNAKEFVYKNNSDDCDHMTVSTLHSAKQNVDFEKCMDCGKITRWDI